MFCAHAPEIDTKNTVSIAVSELNSPPLSQLLNLLLKKEEEEVLSVFF